MWLGTTLSASAHGAFWIILSGLIGGLLVVIAFYLTRREASRYLRDPAGQFWPILRHDVRRRRSGPARRRELERPGTAAGGVRNKLPVGPNAARPRWIASRVFFAISASEWSHAGGVGRLCSTGPCGLARCANGGSTDDLRDGASRALHSPPLIALSDPAMNDLHEIPNGGSVLGRDWGRLSPRPASRETISRTVRSGRAGITSVSWRSRRSLNASYSYGRHGRRPLQFYASWRLNQTPKTVASRMRTSSDSDQLRM